MVWVSGNCSVGGISGAIIVMLLYHSWFAETNKTDISGNNSFISASSAIQSRKLETSLFQYPCAGYKEAWPLNNYENRHHFPTYQGPRSIAADAPVDIFIPHFSTTHSPISQVKYPDELLNL